MPDTVLSYHSDEITASLKSSVKTLVGAMDFSIHQGEKLALIGETGSGKTLTALSIMGLLPQNVKCKGLDIKLQCKGGRTHLGEDVFKTAGSAIVYIPQNGLESLNPHRKVRDHLFDTLRKNGCEKRLMLEKGLDMLKLAGFDKPEDIIGLYPFQLSGGMAQRVTIALAMTGRESLIIADEPTNGLDKVGKDNFLKLLDSRFPEAGKLIITHDMAVADMTDKVIVLESGIVMEQGPSNVVLNNPGCNYTRALIDALVRNGMKETPRLRESDFCCPFYSRCPKACPSCFSVGYRKDGEHSWRCI